MKRDVSCFCDDLIKGFVILCLATRKNSSRMPTARLPTLRAVAAVLGGCWSQCQGPVWWGPLPCGQTDTTENITFATPFAGSNNIDNKSNAFFKIIFDCHMEFWSSFVMKIISWIKKYQLVVKYNSFGRASVCLVCLCKYVHWNGLAAIQSANRWIHGIQARESTLALKPRQTSPEVQNSYTSDPTKRTDIVHNFF